MTSFCPQHRLLHWDSSPHTAQLLGRTMPPSLLMRDGHGTLAWPTGSSLLWGSEPGLKKCGGCFTQWGSPSLPRAPVSKTLRAALSLTFLGPPHQLSRQLPKMSGAGIPWLLSGFSEPNIKVPSGLQAGPSQFIPGVPRL